MPWLPGSAGGPHFQRWGQQSIKVLLRERFGPPPPDLRTPIYRDTPEVRKQVEHLVKEFHGK